VGNELDAHQWAPRDRGVQTSTQIYGTSYLDVRRTRLILTIKIPNPRRITEETGLGLGWERRQLLLG
jgi:hypothetical protein